MNRGGRICSPHAERINKTAIGGNARPNRKSGRGSNPVPLGAINDLTIAAEFLLVALRDVAGGKGITCDSVQQNLDWAVRKIDPMISAPKSVHSGPEGRKA